MFIPRHSTSVYVSRISITACSIHTILQLGLFIPRHYTAIPRHYTAASYVFVPRHSGAVFIPHHDIAASYVFIPRHFIAASYVFIPRHSTAASYVFIPRHSTAMRPSAYFYTCVHVRVAKGFCPPVKKNRMNILLCKDGQTMTSKKSDCMPKGSDPLSCIDIYARYTICDGIRQTLTSPSSSSLSDNSHTMGNESRFFFFFIVALCPRKRDGLLGTGTEWEGDDRVKVRPRKPPEKDRRPWTAARTMEVLKRCPLVIAQRLVHCAIAVSTAMLGQSHKDNVRCTAVDGQTWTTRSKRGPTCSAQLHLPAHDLFWANFKVQLHLPPLKSLDLLISPGTLRKVACRILFLYEHVLSASISMSSKRFTVTTIAPFLSSFGITAL